MKGQNAGREHFGIDNGVINAGYCLKQNETGDDQNDGKEIHGSGAYIRLFPIKTYGREHYIMKGRTMRYITKSLINLFMCDDDRYI